MPSELLFWENVKTLPHQSFYILNLALSCNKQQCKQTMSYETARLTVL